MLPHAFTMQAEFKRSFSDASNSPMLSWICSPFSDAWQRVSYARETLVKTVEKILTLSLEHILQWLHLLQMNMYSLHHNWNIFKQPLLKMTSCIQCIPPSIITEHKRKYQHPLFSNIITNISSLLAALMMQEPATNFQVATAGYSCTVFIQV